MILIPDLADVIQTSESSAERRVAQILHGMDSEPGAIAFHSVKLRTHQYKQHAESDFVILWRGVVIVIEVKGGGISKRDGVWYSINRRGDWQRLPESPMQQARSGMYALRDILRKDGLGWFPQEAIVITPDIDQIPDAVEYSNSHWLTGNELSFQGLANALNHLATVQKRPTTGVERADETEIRERLFGEFTRLPMVDSLRGVVLDEQARATNEQVKFLAGMYQNDRLMLIGGAGTGKSVALSEGAKQDASRGLRVLVTYFSPALQDFFQPRLEGREIDVRPIHDIETSRSYDAVFVDEAQDIMNVAMMDKLNSVISGGIDRGRWRFFLDPNNQAHVDGLFDQDTHEVMTAIADARYNLSTNVRNTRAIVHTVQEYLGADIGDPGIVHGPHIEWLTAINGDEKEAHYFATKMIQNGATPKDVWLVSCRDRNRNHFFNDGIFSTDSRGVKGLETAHVVVYGLPEEFDDIGLSQFYVAITRARFSLHILYTPNNYRLLTELLKERMMRS